MFTGIVEGKGRIVRVDLSGRGSRLGIEVPAELTDLRPGDSISVDGACLTVTERAARLITVDVSSETIEKTTLSAVVPGGEVNLERALRLSDRLGGHIVSGHVDGIGIIREKVRDGDFFHCRIGIPHELDRQVVRKGSIAIDGVSLTVNECGEGEVRLTLIPFTLDKTTLPAKKVGDRVNVETDLIGKYIEKLVTGKGPERKMDLAFLTEHGFVKPG
jgi:riboflavin synthase